MSQNDKKEEFNNGNDEMIINEQSFEKKIKRDNVFEYEYQKVKLENNIKSYTYVYMEKKPDKPD